MPPARGTIGIRRRLASLTTSETSCAVFGRTATSGMWSAQRWTGNGAGTRLRNTRELRLSSTRSSSPMIARSSAITRVVDRALEGDAHGCAPADLDPGRLGDELEEVHHVEVGLGAGLATAAAPTTGRR